MDNEKRDESPNRVKEEKCSLKTGKSGRTSRYNNTVMQGFTVWTMEEFTKRLTALRIEKGVSAREMSLSLGMAANYINSIESGENFPSMSMFFEICEFLNVSPKEFFVYTEPALEQKRELRRLIEQLPAEETGIFLQLIKMLTDRRKP